jgi:hypothetical protein
MIPERCEATARRTSLPRDKVLRKYVAFSQHMATEYCNADKRIPCAKDSVSGHHKPATNGRNDPATKICVRRHFSSKQARINSLMSGLFERKMPLFS